MGASLPSSAAHGSIYWVAWRVLVPIKQSSNAKTRLLSATKSQHDHAQLVHAIQLDTLSAVLAVAKHPLIGGLSVVADLAFVNLPSQIDQIPDAGGGLNTALAAAAANLSSRYPADGVAAIVGDLPALRPADLLFALTIAGTHERSFVRDAGGSGTTLLAAGAGHPLDPHFGIGSALQHHESGAVEIASRPSLRTDVDSAEDLQACLILGVGIHTSQIAALLR